MKKTLFTLAALAIIMASCTQDNLEIEQEDNRTFTVSAAMPEEPGTRITFETDETTHHGIILKWEENDKLLLNFKYGDKYYKAEAPIDKESISANGKYADFIIALPEGVPTDATFDFSVVYQRLNYLNEGFKKDTPNFQLQGPEEKNITLNQTTSKGDQGIINPLVYDYKTSITKASIGTINLKHTGWILALHFKNTTSKEIDYPVTLTFLNMFGSENDEKFLGNNNNFNPSTGVFSGTPISVFSYSINEGPETVYQDKKLAAGESAVFYRWVVRNSGLDNNLVMDNMILQLELKNVVNKFKKTEALLTKTVEIGKVYHIYTEWDGSEFKYVQAP